MSSPVLLVARREVRARLQQRGYLIGVAVTLLVVIAAAVVPSFFHGGRTSYDVSVVGVDAASLSEAVRAEAAAQHVTVHLHEADAATAQARVRSGAWDAALIDDRRIVASSTSAAAALLQAAHRSVAIEAALERAGLSGSQIAAVYATPAVAVDTVANDHQAARRALATIVVVLLFAQLITFCSWVAVGVVEEKSSRVIEVVLSAISPLRLLTGKLLGIGALAIGQTILMGVVGLVAAGAAGTLTIPGGGWNVIAVAVVAFVLGFGFFASLASALASTVSRQEEVSGVLVPMTVLLMVSYGASFAVTSSLHSTMARVFSMVPPVSAIAMPARIAGGDVAVLDMVIAALGLVVAVVLMLMLAARIYRSSILHTGDKLSLRRAWHSEAVGSDS